MPKHLTGSRVEQFLEEFLAIKALVKAEAEKIWNGCSNVHQMISVAANDEKRRVFSEQFDRWRDQLIGLQEILIVDRLRPLVSKYQILANEQIWLLRACHEAWSPVTAGYLDWLTVAVLGHPHGVGSVGTGAIPEWAWQLRSASRDVAPEKKASGHFRCLADTLQRELVERRKGAIAKAFLARKTNESPVVDSGMGRLEPKTDHRPVTTQAGRQHPPLPPRVSDYSNLLDPAGLTELQRECFSLRYEYQLPVAEIARRLGRDRKTIQEHIDAANNKIKQSGIKERAGKRLARFGLDSLGPPKA